MKRTFIVLLMAAAVIGSARAYAHHSQVAVYESTKTMTIEGKVAAVQIRSPHSWIQVEVDEKDEAGKPVRIGIEWGSAAQLTRSGINNKTLKVGDTIKVTGRPPRDKADRRMLVMTMERPSDGWKWPTIAGEVVD